MNSFRTASEETTRGTMRQSVHSFCLIMTGLFLFWSIQAHAHNATVRVVYTEWYPYTYTENGRPEGFEIEILEAVLDSMQIQPDYQPLPWKRCLSSLETGAADMLVSMLYTEERSAFTLFPEENISESTTSFFVLAGNPITFDGDYANLQEYTVGVIRGFSYGEAFDHAEYLVKDNSTDIRTLLEKLLARRIDIAAENTLVATAEADDLGVLHEITFLTPPIHSQKLYVGFSRINGLEKFCKDFSSSLSAFKKTERYRTILEAYHVNPGNQ